jgi:hypothetical protein
MSLAIIIGTLLPMPLTLSQKHNILWSIAVSGPKARPKRESGANPELSRSGNWERT